MRKYLLCLALILSAASTVKAEASDTRVFIDNGILYGVSEQSVLKSNLRTGEFEITYIDGTVIHRNSKIPHGTRSAFWHLMPELFWIKGPIDKHRGLGTAGMDSDFSTLSTSCSQEANSLTAAIAAVEAACSGDGAGTASCQSAYSHYQTAESAYSECMKHALQMR